MQRAAVTSSTIVSVGHDATAALLEVEFKGGAVYQYRGVSAEVHAELMAAESVGKHFAEHIKGHFDYVKLPKPIAGM